MKLSRLITDCPGISSAEDTAARLNDPDIVGVESDSRRIKPGMIFIAVKGAQADGHAFIGQALKQGAAAVIAQENNTRADNVIRVDDSRACMAVIAANFYGHPSREMTLVGITGTNGKTTVTWLLESMLNAAGHSCGVIGTVNIRFNHQSVDNPMTTPDAIRLQESLHRMKQAGVTHVVMEVSSHGLDLNRVDACRFDVGVFTNLSQDHLDYHPDMTEYFECKKRLFTRFLSPASPQIQRPEKGYAVINIDDPRGASLFDSIDYGRLGVSTRQPADIVSQHISDDINGLSGTICLPDGSFEFCSELTGRFNLENILCAAGAASALGVPARAIKQGISACRTIPGRLEKIPNTLDRHLFVDYAHTPDALESILTTLKSRTPKRLITVFGCGGDRDRRKRPLMGKIAARLSNIAIATSDNPRTENPDDIITDILEGMKDFSKLSRDETRSDPFKKGFLVEPDRKKAIENAVAVSKPGDTIIVAGKGHETYQVTNDGTIHFDDGEELSAAAQAMTETFTPMDWDINDLSTALGMEPVFSTLPKGTRFSTIVTDSRTIKNDQVFLALKGERFDGHTFVQDLLKQGIKGFVVEKGFFTGQANSFTRDAAQSDLIIFEAADTLTALGQLGRYQRLRSNVKLVAITGSSGKTTTRRLTQEIFSTRYHTHATAKNYNNEIGVPLTLLNLSAAHEWAVIEMGMNHAGEISRLSRMARPDIAVITNTAAVHLEGLGTVENVARAKAEIFDGINPAGTAVLNARDGRRAILQQAARSNKNVGNILFFGSGPDATVTADHILTKDGKTAFTVCTDRFEYPVLVDSPARFMVDNCLAAVAAAQTAGIDPASVQAGIAAFQPESGRMRISSPADGIHLMDDTYNANPASVSQALTTLVSLSNGEQSIAVLGDMLELGKDSASLHYRIGQQAARDKIDRLFLFGSLVEEIEKGAVDSGFPADRILWADKDRIVQSLVRSIRPGTWILVKGSRGMAMETVINRLKQEIRPGVRGEDE